MASGTTVFLSFPFKFVDTNASVGIPVSEFSGIEPSV